MEKTYKIYLHFVKIFAKIAYKIQTFEKIHHCIEMQIVFGLKNCFFPLNLSYFLHSKIFCKFDDFFRILHYIGDRKLSQ